MSSKCFMALGAALVLLGVAGASEASATVVTFDNLPGDELVPNGYGGIDWNGNWNAYQDVQPPYNPESPPFRVFTFSGTGDFTFPTPTVFDGAYFSGQSAATVQFTLFDGATLVGTSGVLAPSSTPTFLASGYSGPVTRVDVNSPEPDFYVMDNVTFGGVGAAPEPATWAMMLLGIGGVGATLRSARRKQLNAVPETA